MRIMGQKLLLYQLEWAQSHKLLRLRTKIVQMSLCDRGLLSKMCKFQNKKRAVCKIREKISQL